MRNKKKLVEYLSICGVIFVLVFMWYGNNHWSVLMGDDLIAVTGFKDLGFWGNLFNTTDISTGKIRPVQKIMLYIVYFFCGVDYEKYYYISRIILAIVAVITYILMQKMNLGKVKSIFVVLMLITCPFSAYGAWQFIGVSESFSLIISLIYGYYIQKFWREEGRKKFECVLWSVLWFAILIFNAERFMYIVAVMIIAIFFSKDVKWKNKIIYSVISTIPIVVRSVFLKCMGSVALGTGRSGISELLSTFIPYATKGFINMLGFSIGDSWHGGFNLLQIPPFIIVLSSIRVFLFFGVLFEVVKKSVFLKQKQYIDIIFWYLLSLTSLFSYALVASTHGEDRFLWISYVFYLIALVKYLKIEKSEMKLERKKGFSIFFCCITMCLLCSNGYYKINKVGVHFRYSQEIAETAIESIKELDDYSSVENIACINSNDYKWIFYGNSFFNYYLKDSVNVFYFDSIEAFNIEKEKLGRKTIVVYPDVEYPIPYGAKASWSE